MTVKLKCPVCGDFGVLMKKTTITQTTKRKYRYQKWYVYHNRSKGTTQRWCYLSKKYLRLSKISEAIFREQATQNTTQTTQKTNKPKLASNREKTVSGGVRVWSKETGLGPVGVGLRGFKSRPPHHNARFIVKPESEQHTHLDNIF